MFYDWDDLWVGGLLNNKSKSFRELWIKGWVTYLEKHLPKISHHVTTCSQFLARLAAARNAPRISVIPNGFWPFEIPDKKAARERLGLDPRATYVGFMGKTIAELSWCFEGLESGIHRHENLRFALCGPTPEALNGLSEDTRRRIDYLGSLPPLKTREFAAAIDLGLLPLENNSFNQSRFPIKYTEYMAAGTPVLCSEIGECQRLSVDFPWVFKAGKSRSQWLDSFERAVGMAVGGSLAQVDVNAIERSLSWDSIGKGLLDIYRSELERQ